MAQTDPTALAWSLLIVYLACTAYLGWRGHRRTRDFSSFAIGRGDMHPVVVGITLAASTASAGTFIINPGFIYVDGLSAWLHMVLGTFLGLIFMLSILSFRFRRIGERAGALTIPDWIGKRYQSWGFKFYFALLSLLSFAFVVLQVGGISIVMQQLLGISNVTALLITLTFVTGYVFVGGTYAHVLTNLLQGSLMILVTLVILGSGLSLALPDLSAFIDSLRAEDPGLLAWVNRDGQLFNNVFSIYVAGFLVGIAISCQPNVLTKALYVESDRAVRDYLIVFAVVVGLFLLLGTVGFFAHLAVSHEQLIDPALGTFRQDLVMTVYLTTVFPDWVFTVIGIVLLAAAMSTLDGLLVALSTTSANDLALSVMQRFSTQQVNREEEMRIALRIGHVVLVIIAVLAFLVNLEPPRLLLVFGQIGILGLAVATLPPVVAGVMFQRVPLPLVWSASLAGVLAHFILYFFGATLLPAGLLTVENPAVTAAVGIIVGVLPILAATPWLRSIQPAQH